VVAASALALALVAGACGGGDGGEETGGGDEGGTPQYGGEATYGLEAETSGGWCLPEAQLAISGIQVSRAVYDTLTVPNEDGGYSPSLAESVIPNADYTQWTIKVREGVTFHDGSPLDAQVVKNNLDAFRGAYPTRKPLLFLFVYQNIDTVEVVDPMTVSVTTKGTWPALPAYLWFSGRAGILAQAQLDDTESCDTNLIGTGPFKLMDGGEWVVNDHLTAVRNDDYWMTDADGNELPYLDSITFRPIVDDTARVNAVLAGDVDLVHASSAGATESLEAAADSGEVELTQTSRGAEVTYGMLNTARPPFSSKNARLAAAYALDREEFKQVINLGMFELASGPFSPGEMGHLEDSGYPDYDEDTAKEYLAAYEEECGGCELEFTFAYQNDPATKSTVQWVQAQAEAVGIKVNLKPLEQAALIGTALGGDWDAITFRNHPGGDPDTQYLWWYGGSPLNFGQFDDDEVNRLLDAGRTETDPAARKGIYEDLNRRFASEAFNLWQNWVQWTIAAAPEVDGVYGPDLPDGSAPYEGLSVGHSVTGLWVSS
jgi:peptide/nickel transport system substrate-binding protein